MYNNSQNFNFVKKTIENLFRNLKAYEIDEDGNKEIKFEKIFFKKTFQDLILTTIKFFYLKSFTIGQLCGVAKDKYGASLLSIFTSQKFGNGILIDDNNTIGEISETGLFFMSPYLRSMEEVDDIIKKIENKKIKSSFFFIIKDDLIKEVEKKYEFKVNYLFTEQELLNIIP